MNGSRRFFKGIGMGEKKLKLENEIQRLVEIENAIDTLIDNAHHQDGLNDGELIVFAEDLTLLKQLRER